MKNCLSVLQALSYSVQIYRTLQKALENKRCFYWYRFSLMGFVYCVT